MDVDIFVCWLWLINEDPRQLTKIQQTRNNLNGKPGCRLNNNENNYGKYLSPAQFISEIKDIEFKLLILKGKLYQELKENF